MSESSRQWKVGFIGLGKLGLPVATAMALRGADVLGYDVDPQRMSYAPQSYQETGPDGAGDFNDWLALCNEDGADALEGSGEEPPRSAGRLRFGSLDEIVAHADLVFVAVQTPHDERFSGTQPLREPPVDFSYVHLRSAVSALVEAKNRSARREPIPVAVISTALPGTMYREVIPRLTTDLPLVYNPSFIAMGTTMRDFLDPEFVLLGVDDHGAASTVSDFYATLLPVVPQRRMSVVSAELSKVLYNTALSQKIALANTVMELCHKLPGASVNDVTGAMKAAHRRVISPAYMDGGMGDGGGCHPRDNIAMMWLAKNLSLSYDPFTPSMVGRERQSLWLKSLILKHLPPYGEITILGYAYKPGTNITTGSPALLLANQLRVDGWTVSLKDHHVDPRDSGRPTLMHPGVVFIGCRHAEYIGYTGSDLPAGSVIIDPFRICGVPVEGVRLVQVGIGTESSAVHAFGARRAEA